MAGKSKGNPHNPGNPHTLDQAIDEVRDEIMRTLFRTRDREILPGEAEGTTEYNWFEGAKRCDLVNILEVASLIETTENLDRETRNADERMPAFDFVKWGHIRSNFYGAIQNNCYCSPH